VLVKAVNPAPLSVDLNAKIKYQDLLWFGASWRAFDSVVGMVGISYEQLTVGYSYDAPNHSKSWYLILALRSTESGAGLTAFTSTDGTSDQSSSMGSRTPAVAK
jgi:hypothetical protein